MTAEEMKELAFKAAQKQVDNYIIPRLKEAVDSGKTNIALSVSEMSELTKGILEDAGYKVQKKTHRVPGLRSVGATEYWEVSTGRQ